MKQTSLLLLVFGFAASLFAADPIEGTWKLNPAKSKGTGSVPLPKEATAVFQEKGETIEMVLKNTASDGTVLSSRSTMPKQGGVPTFTEGAPSAGTVVTFKLSADGHTVGFTTTKDGKVVEANRTVISKDGKTARETLKGTDPQGKPFEHDVVWDKQ